MSQWLKMGLEVGPLIVFFVVFQLCRDSSVMLFGQEYKGVVFATAVFIPTMLAAVGLSWALTRHLPRMSVVTAVVVVVFGGLTLLLNDETFIMMKPTIANGLFALVLGYGLVQGKSYLSYLMGDALPLSREGWMAFTRNWMVFFIVMAGLNELIWRNLSTEFWVAYRTFGGVTLTVLFMASQWPLLKRHGLDIDR